MKNVQIKKRPGRVDAEYSTSAIPNKPIPPDILTDVLPELLTYVNLSKLSLIHCTKL